MKTPHKRSGHGDAQRRYAITDWTNHIQDLLLDLNTFLFPKGYRIFLLLDFLVTRKHEPKGEEVVFEMLERADALCPSARLLDTAVCTW